MSGALTALPCDQIALKPLNLAGVESLCQLFDTADLSLMNRDD